ncbi:hypothetical protein Tco_1480391, partial [Tanacetum coccineum]
MNPITSQQAALDNSLITAKVPEIYMHQFWNTIKKIGKTDPCDFKLDKKKCRVDTKVFCEILQIYPRLPDQDFVELPSEEDLLTFIKNLVPPKKARKFKKPASPKLKTVPASPKEPTQKGKSSEKLTSFRLVAQSSEKLTSKLLNLDNTNLDVNEIASLMNTSTVPSSPPPVNPSSHLTTTPQQQTPNSTTITTNPTITFPKIPNFASLFWFEQRVSALETKLSEFNKTSQFTEAVSSIPSIVDQYLASKMKEAVDVVVRLQSNKLKEEAEAENQELFNQVDSTMKAVIKEQVKAQVFKIMPQIEKYVTESLGAEVLINQSTSDILRSSSFIVRI